MKNLYITKNVILSISLCFLFQMNAQCWKTISTGAYHTVALKQDGTLWAWGSNNKGQLGDGTTTNRNAPIQVGTDSNWISVSSAFNHTLAIKTDGTLWSWGNNDWGVLGYPDVAFSLGYYTTPVQVGTSTNWETITAGFIHTVAIKTDGTLWAWGRIDASGFATQGYSQSTPFNVSTATDWKDVAAGVGHTLYLKNNGTLYAGGNYAYGALGLGTNVTTTNTTYTIQVGVDTNWNSIAAGYFISTATKSDGTLWTWGLNSYGQLGDGSTTNKIIPTQIGVSTDWKKVFPFAINENNTCHNFAMKNDNTLWGWGKSTYGELGDGTTTTRNVPIQIGTATDWEFISSQGDYHTIGLKSDKSLFGFGYNNAGQLGDGSVINRLTPVAISCTTLSVKKNEINKTTALYPNPNNGKFSINSNKELVNQVKIYSLDGKLIFAQNTNTVNPEISLESISKGIYLATVTLENGLETRSKIIIE